MESRVVWQGKAADIEMRVVRVLTSNRGLNVLERADGVDSLGNPRWIESTDSYAAQVVADIVFDAVSSSVVDVLPLEVSVSPTVARTT